MPDDISIDVATIRETSWIAAHMRDIDKQELYCQVKEEKPTIIAYMQLNTSPRFSYTASIAGEPVMAFGLAEWQPGIAHLWAFGTKRMYGAIKKVTDFINNDIYGQVFADSSIHRVECRSISTHLSAHRWIEKIGLHFVTDLPCYGKNAEDFKLFALTRNEVGYVQHTSPAARSGTSNTKRRRTKGKKRRSR